MDIYYDEQDNDIELSEHEEDVKGATKVMSKTWEDEINHLEAWTKKLYAAKEAINNISDTDMTPQKFETLRLHMIDHKKAKLMFDYYEDFLRYQWGVIQGDFCLN